MNEAQDSTGTKPRSIFRAEALDQLSSPEQLEQLLQVTNRKSWITLATLGFLIFVVLLWSIFGRIPVTVNGTGILIYPRQVMPFQASVQGQLSSMNIAVGDRVQAGQVIAVEFPPNLADQPPTASAISQLFVAPVNGMQELVGRLVEALDETRIELDAPVSEIARTDGRWQLTVQGRPPIEADAVVVALPVPPTAALIGRLDRQIGSELIEIESTSVATVAMVWRREELSAESLNLSGFLVPERERRLVSWCSVSSVTWEGRSDDDHVAVRALLRGGSELLRWEDDELVSRARTDLRDLLGVEAEPSLVHVVRHPWSLPVFDLHHGERLTRIEERLAEWSGLGLGGSLWQGPGISNVVDAAERAVRKVNADLDC